MIKESLCNELINDYIKWLHKSIKIKDIDGTYEITTPFVDRHNDFIQIYVKKNDQNIIITDDGYTLADLKLSGFDFSTEKRQQILKTILNGFGIKLENEELITETSPENFPHKKHNFIQAIMAINDLFVLSAPVVISVFREDVEKFLKEHEIRFVPSVSFTGKSGFVHLFDFVIPSSQKKPERIIKAINQPDKQKITSLIFSWTDTKETRAPDTVAYGILNDSDRKVAPELINAMNQYEIKTLLWSERDKYIEELAA
ncbi:MAG: DUF1828 domain-containing protein [Thermoplasmata archaeon]